VEFSVYSVSSASFLECRENKYRNFLSHNTCHELCKRKFIPYIIIRIDRFKSSQKFCKILRAVYRLTMERNNTESESEYSWLINNDPPSEATQCGKQKKKTEWKPKFRLATRILSDAVYASDVKFDWHDILMFTEWMELYAERTALPVKNKRKTNIRLRDTCFGDCSTLINNTASIFTLGGLFCYNNSDNFLGENKID